MPSELYARRLEGFLELSSACGSLGEYDPLIDLLVRRTPYLVEFERLSILLCDESRQILRATVIQEQSSREVSPDEIPLSEMDLILQTLITGRTSKASEGLCTPMVSVGRLIGVMCLATNSDKYTSRDVKLVQFLSDTLAGTLERIMRGRETGSIAEQSSPAMDAYEASVAKTHAVSLHMSFLAQHDTLTGLPNRCLLHERLTRALALSSRYRRRLAVLFLDLDRFKEINDSLGHAVGDQVLRQISERLVSCVRASDTVSRMGGDEFVILLAELEDEKAAATCALKIISAVNAPLVIDSHAVHLGVSIGIGVYPGDGKDAETLLANADAAMYRAKAKRNGEFLFFHSDMNIAVGDPVLPLERPRRPVARPSAR